MPRFVRNDTVAWVQFGYFTTIQPHYTSILLHHSFYAMSKCERNDTGMWVQFGVSHMITTSYYPTSILRNPQVRAQRHGCLGLVWRIKVY